MRDPKQEIEEDLKIEVGIGATKSVGSDCYPYYISEVLPNGVIGVYRPSSHFDETHPWEGGTEVVDAFDPKHKSELYLKRSYGKWWEVSKDGKERIRKFESKWVHFSIGHASSYQNPSF